MARFFVNVIFFITVIYFPWWVLIFLSLVVLFKFENFYEIVLWGFVGDLLYGIPIVALFGFPFLFSAGGLFLLLAVEYMKTKIRFYT